MVLMILTLCVAGADWPIWYGKVNLLTLVEMTGSLVIFSTTANCWAALPGVAETTLTVAEYVPAASPAGLTETGSGAAVLPALGTDSHAELALWLTA